MKKIKVWVKDPGEVPRHVYISNTLENLKRTVGGYIETFPVFSDLLVICNEDGKLDGLPYNCSICGERFVGTIIFVGVDGEEFADCPDDIERMKSLFPQLWRV